MTKPYDYADDTDDDRDHKNDSYTAAGAGPLVLAPWWVGCHGRVATYPPRPTRQNENENKNENSRTPAGPQTNAPRDNITPCGSPTPHSNI